MLDKKNLLLSLAFTIFVILCFLLALLFGKKNGLDQSAVAAICSAATIALSALIALMALQHNRKNTQEPWMVTFRELHKEFWDDDDMTKVRTWICCDEAYRLTLLPVLNRRLSGQVSRDEYLILDTLDKFLALMLRVVIIQSSKMSNEQKKIFKGLNYYWWLHQARNRTEIYKYIEITTETLYPFVRDAKFHDSNS